MPADSEPARHSAASSRNSATTRSTCFRRSTLLYNALLNQPDFGKIDWSMLKCAIGGGMAVQKSVADAWVKATGKPIIEGYGLSGNVAGAHVQPRRHRRRGPAPSDCRCLRREISIRDDDGRGTADSANRARSAGAGRRSCSGYWQRPDETSEGDDARRVLPHRRHRRDGRPRKRVHIVDRKKDMISVSGFKVFPNEVEEVAMSQGGLLECAVVGVPDQHSGEVAKLFAVKKNPDVHRRLTCAHLLASHVSPATRCRGKSSSATNFQTNVGKILQARPARRSQPTFRAMT